MTIGRAQSSSSPLSLSFSPAFPLTIYREVIYVYEHTKSAHAATWISISQRRGSLFLLFRQASRSFAFSVSVTLKYTSENTNIISGHAQAQTDTCVHHNLNATHNSPDTHAHLILSGENIKRRENLLNI